MCAPSCTSGLVSSILHLTPRALCCRFVLVVMGIQTPNLAQKKFKSDLTTE
ncbi:hypothetical protein SEA_PAULODIABOLI_378 [Microbacterium phage PauloDiaboli]|nr:hypothetical protein SEA_PAULODIABOLI_23 [Microbacterium phage PauloDiaboli]QIG58089.1 hypothetical protein SEA_PAULODIABOLI_378 [Microbacterium phage PauloDiaboli]QWY83873.1 hypothetical protein SEA_A3WALLY_23 [Microbacterium phage A3Wally]QWY84183.1 hypothetical protein SEA_A3WALLY_376 [Microbacterium phage A3Wally]